MFIDTHTHLSLNDYDNLDLVIKSAKSNGVKYLVVSCCSKDSIVEGLELLKEYNNIFLTVGFHPSEINGYTEEDLRWLVEISKNNKQIVGIGEIGLDYFYSKDNKEKQKLLFQKQLEIASFLKLPVVIHTRESTKDTLDILSKYNLRGVIHCFSGSAEVAEEYLKLGYYLGIGGVLTFKNSKLGETLKNIPLEKIVLETDSPYLSPEPLRGTKNESKNIPIIAKKLADIKNCSIEDIKKTTTSNALRVFDLPLEL